MNYDKVIELVKHAGETVFDENLRSHVSMKGEADFLTEVDLRISSVIKQGLLELYPDSSFFSEEDVASFNDLPTDSKDNLKSPCWILDPIDGTTNLCFGYRLCSVSLGLWCDGGIVFGVVYNPFDGECFTAQVGKGAWLDGKRLSVSCREAKDSLVEFGAGSTHKDNAAENFALVQDIFCNCVDIRRICSSALDLCYIAAGRIDGYFEKVLKPWDYAAGSLILSEAGGIITDYNNAPISFTSPSSVIAGNKAVHEFLCKKIKAHLG